MFSKKKPAPRVVIDQFSSFDSRTFLLAGDLKSQDGLKISGTVRGNVLHKPGSHSLLALSAEGRIDGNVSSFDALIDGTVVGGTGG
ncbi:Cell shape determination protein CcmA OS=Stutzerimonas stutzeri OX=316 GN=CXK95_03195 PE=4 SV=1 [Stutzerimonas stutzeri]